MKNFLKFFCILVVGVVVGIIINSLFLRASTVIAGGDIRNPGDTSPAGIVLGSGRGTAINWAGDKILPRANTATWRNTTGKPAYINYAQVSTDNFASSTYKIFAWATTTAPTNLYDFTAPANNATTTLAINGFQFATSSAATTTTNFDKAFNGRTVMVPANGYFVIKLVETAGTCTSVGVLCETATSTGRGFNLQWRISYND